MKSRLTAIGRRRLSGVVLVAVLALVAAGASQGSPTPSTVKSPIYNHRDDCTNDPAKHPIGTATFTRNKKNILTVKVVLHGADPGHWDLGLFTGDCSTFFELGNFNVNANGEGSKVGTVDITGYGNTFFADPTSQLYDNETDIVKV